ncbi:uncharacterized protein JCM15063_000949 [Sporobolomyces koalae]|uniref:uncharacterized protein n=1 Tax=Sporobolomyces koalae TaxID=500713 RepID=UPI0031728F22
MRLIITGATGSAGSEVLRQALQDARITAVTTLTRTPLPSYFVPTDKQSDKLTQIVHPDFSNYPSELLERLSGHDACIWALGTSSIGMNEPDYTRVTHEFATNAARAFSQINVNRDDCRKFVFAYLSGARSTQSPTPSTQGWFNTPMWARVKGRTESDLAKVPNLATYSFRPAFIVSDNLPPPEYRTRYNTPLLKFVGTAIGAISDTGAVRAETLAKAMIRACLEGSNGKVEGWEGKGVQGDAGVFENSEIKRLGSGLAAH